MDTLAQMTCGQSSLAWLMILVCGFLMLIVLIQRGRGGGLSGAFGGGGGGGGAFGAKTGDVFTWITVIVATVFVLLAVVSNFVFDLSSVAAQPESAISSATDTEEAGEIGEEAPPADTSLVPSGDAAPAGGKTGTDEAEKDSDTKKEEPSAVDAPAKSGDEGSAAETGGEGAGEKNPPAGDTAEPEADKPDPEGNAKP